MDNCSYLTYLETHYFVHIAVLSNQCHSSNLSLQNAAPQSIIHMIVKKCKSVYHIVFATDT